ncbi:MAG: transposase [Acidimicrobiia bacterium]|nr:transposase [Acidimicrobiia bacterium]
MSEQRWSALDAISEHKAAKAGIRYVRVNAAYTSTDCSQCGHRQPMPLNKRVYDCRRCGMVLCRDVNAATNICARAFPRLGDRAGKEETPPGVTRTTNFCQGDRPPPRGATQADATQQYHL